MYMPSTTPLPPNSQNPGPLPPMTGPGRTARIMARGRLSNQQCQPDHPCNPCNLSSSEPLVRAGVLPPSATSAATPAVATYPWYTGPNPRRPSTAAAAGSASGPTSNWLATLLGGGAAASPYTAAQQQYIAEAPEMLVGRVATITCGATAEDEPVETHPRSSPPWGNAIITQGGTQGSAFGGIGAWISENLWLTLVLVAVGGMALTSGSKR